MCVQEGYFAPIMWPTLARGGIFAPGTAPPPLCAPSTLSLYLDQCPSITAWHALWALIAFQVERGQSRARLDATGPAPLSPHLIVQDLVLPSLVLPACQALPRRSDHLAPPTATALGLTAPP